jgi:hypothetical protein
LRAITLNVSTHDCPEQRGSSSTISISSNAATNSALLARKRSISSAIASRPSRVWYCLPSSMVGLFSFVMSFNPCNLITYSIVHFLATEFPTVPRRPSNGCEGYALIGDYDAIANLHVLIVHISLNPQHDALHQETD